MSPPPARVAAWTAARSRLEEAGVASPAIDARLLLEAASGLSRAEILAEPRALLSAEAAARLERLVERRAAREPVSRILGRKGFWTIELALTGDVLAPRPETETVVEQALAAAPADAPVRLLDLGVGSGAILLALLAERPSWRGVGVDLSAAAVAVAQANARRLGLGDRALFVRADWAMALAGGVFDLVVANPPYVASGDIAGLEPEVRDYEPRLAIDGGPDGLAAYRRLAGEMQRVAAPGAPLVLEVGQGQADAVAALLEEAGARGARTIADLSGIRRVVMATASR